jgi:hypothetical protein
MWLTRSMAGSASGGLTWDQPGAVVEVPDDLALELLAIPGAGFAEVAAPDAGQGPDKAEEPTPDTEQADVAEPEAPEPPAAKRATRARKPVAE